MKIKKIIINFVALFSFFSVQGQEIRGRVLNEEGISIEYATVVLQTLDSIYVQSVYTDTLGNFSYNKAVKPFRLIIQHLLYETETKEYTNPDVGIVRMKRKTNLLQEVSVRGRRPLIEVSEGKLVYNMPFLIENKPVNNAYDALLELPGVREDNGYLLLTGANTLSIIINGKPSTMPYPQLAELLKNMPSSMINKAEIMYVAPAQYHVRGAAINLIMKKDHFENLFGQINLGYEQKFYDNYRTGASLFYNNSKIYTDILYSVNESKTRTGLDLDSHHFFENQLYNINQTNRGKSESLTHLLRLGLDYALTEKDNISGVYTTQFVPKYNSLEDAVGNYSNSFNEKTNTVPIQMHNISMNYTSGLGLSGGADYTHYKNQMKQDFKDTSREKETVFSTNSDQSIDRIKAYLDQKHQIKNNWSLSYGIEFTYVEEKSSQFYYSQNGYDWSGLNTNYNQKEYTYDMYAGFSKSISPKLSLSGALMTEYYKLNDYDEWSLFPTLSSTYFFSPDHIFQFNFSTNKIYPTYWEINDHISYLNGYAEIRGNPRLKPYISYSAQLSYILKNRYIVTLYNIYNDDYFVQLPYQSTNKLSLIYQTINFDYQQMSGINLTIPFTKKRYISHLTLNGFYYRVKNTYFHDISFDKSKYIFYVQWDNTIKLSNQPDIKIDLKGFYYSNSLQGPSELTTVYKLDAGIKWTSSNKKAELNLKSTDILDTWTPNLTMKYDNQNIDMDVLPDSRAFVSLSFVYRFGGNVTEKERKEINTSRFGK